MGSYCSKDPSVSAGINILAKKCNITGFEKFIRYQNSCYSLFDDPSTKLSFLDAENHCKSLGTGGHLASIGNSYESAFTRYYMEQRGKANQYLIGLQSIAESDTNDTQLFVWSDDWPVYYTNWKVLEPKLPKTPEDQCVVQNNVKDKYVIGAWNTVSCNSPYSYMCKVTKSPKPNVHSGATNGFCPKLNGNTDRSLDWVNLHKVLPYCYWFSIDRKSDVGASGYQSWSDASFHCRRRNGTLVSFHAQDEVNILMTRLKKYDYFYGIWIGLSKNPEGIHLVIFIISS